MKLLKIISWLGLSLITISLPLSFSSSNTWISTGEIGSGAGFGIVWIVTIIGTVLALIGGLIAKPQHLWIGLILVGALYIASFYGWIIKEPEPGLALMLLPGILLIAEGIAIRTIWRKIEYRG